MSTIVPEGAPPPPLFALPKASKKPVAMVAHPKASMTLEPDLRIHGESKVASLSITTMNAEAAARKCHPFVGTELRQGPGRPKPSLPPLTSRSHSVTSRAASLDGLDAHFKHMDKGKYRNTIVDSPHYSTPEVSNTIAFGLLFRRLLSFQLIYLLHGKVASGLHGLKHLFKINDPSGQGRITRYGQLSQEFVQWMSPYQGAPLGPMPAAGHPEGHLRVPAWALNQTVSAALLYSQLRMAARSRDFLVRDVLPEECFKGATVLAPQFKSMLDNLGYNMAPQEFVKLWKRFDVKQIGAVKLKAFLEQLGLDTEGVPVLVQRAQSVMQVPATRHKTVSPRKEPEITKEPKKENESNVAPNEEPKKKVRTKGTKKATIFKMSNVVDNLFYVFEEPFQALLQGIECFDFTSDGHISRIDLQKVLAEFGFHIDAMDLEHFLSRIGVRTINGVIAYKEFLLKFWNRSPMGMVNRIVSNSQHPFQKGDFTSKGNGSLSGPELEAALVEYLHGKYFKLMSALKEMDKQNIGLVKQYNFKDAVESCLGYSIEPNQWQQLLSQIGVEEDGLVKYQKFMNIFNIAQPGLWNRKEQIGQVVSKVRKIETPAEVNKLKAMSQQDFEKHQKVIQERETHKQKFTQNLDNMIAAIAKPQPVSIDEMQIEVYTLFRDNFHYLDRAFKNQDRRMTGRFGKVQFTEILKNCGVQRTPNDVTKLWKSFNLDNDGLLTFTALIRFISDFALAKGLPPPTDVTMPATASAEDHSGVSFNGYHSYAYKRVPTMY
ncbi:hypothetical protein CAPTEDRAFT_219946 [Capitella teleta]|uniref:EF-hand domain-containing protein n=1 Tax=Capitella teleta TaxID=283909 RepID=R7TBY7_CAPTE|nr:hypothetical protein CAPTEDRAFT_219946 [Capitella teleta]|eukprot:ELT89007.1 hypothetical protein CAPTEDRAFT_219946 [Capitella teleta]